MIRSPNVRVWCFALSGGGTAGPSGIKPVMSRIEAIETVNLHFAYAPEHRFRYGGGICTGRLTTLAFVHLENGRTGVGSAYTHPGMAYLVIQNQLAPMLRGLEADAVEEIWERMYGLTRWYGRKGAAMSALGAVDVALWDLRGQARREPLWSLLGGATSRCPIYASALLWKAPEALAQEAAGLIDRGFRRVKMRLARGEEYDRVATQAVRTAIGPDHDLIVDASMRYHLELAVRLGAFFKELDVFWYEEPFAPENLDDFAALRPRVDVPLAAGENEFGYQGFRELLRAKAVDIVQPDASRCGGITEILRIAHLAQQHNTRVASHSWSDAIAIVANAHVIGALCHGITVEMDCTGNPLVDELLKTPLRVHEGHFDLGDAPGLGIELDREVVERYRMSDPLACLDGVYSDMMFGTGNFPEQLPYLEKA